MHTHSSATGGRLAEQWATVAAFASAVDASLDRWLMENYRLGLSEYRALTHVSASSDKELRIAELAQRVGLTSTSTTRLVSRLEGKGLARRDVCQDDGRGVFAVIDPKGEAVLAEARGPYEARVRELLGGLGAQFPMVDARALRSALEGVGALLSS